MNIYIALQNKNGISCLTVVVNKRQLTMPFGDLNCYYNILPHKKQIHELLIYTIKRYCVVTLTLLVNSEGPPRS
jgi:hypothetical protein